MEFVEIEQVPTPPEFILKLSLLESIELYKILCKACNSGDSEANKFASALSWFAEKSNRYTKYLENTK